MLKCYCRSEISWCMLRNDGEQSATSITSSISLQIKQHRQIETVRSESSSSPSSQRLQHSSHDRRPKLRPPIPRQQPLTSTIMGPKKRQKLPPRRQIPVHRRRERSQPRQRRRPVRPLRPPRHAKHTVSHNSRRPPEPDQSHHLHRPNPHRKLLPSLPGRFPGRRQRIFRPHHLLPRQQQIAASGEHIPLLQLQGQSERHLSPLRSVHGERRRRLGRPTGVPESVRRHAGRAVLRPGEGRRGVAGGGGVRERLAVRRRVRDDF